MNPSGPSNATSSKPGRREPPADLRREVGFAPVTGPHHGRVRRAERRQRVDRVLDVGVGDVAEHAVGEHHVGGDRARVGRRVGRVAADDLDTGRRGRARRATLSASSSTSRAAHVGARADARRARRSGRGPGPRTSLTTRIGPGGHASQRVADVPLHDREPLRERGCRDCRRPRARRPSLRRTSLWSLSSERFLDRLDDLGGLGLDQRREALRSRRRRGRRGTSRSSSGCRRCGLRRRRSA